MLLGIALHGALSFVQFPWVVQDSRQHDGFGLLFFAAHGFRMPVFFVLSGFFTAMLWRRRGLRSLLRQRLRRIVLPLVLCMVTVVPAVNWVSGMAIESAFKGAARKPSTGADIWAAAQQGDTAAIEAQLDAGVDANGQNPASGGTALAVAALFDQTEAVGLLLSRGADVDARSRDGATALHAAAFLGHAGPARLLIEAGADLDARNASGATPMQALAADWETTQFIGTILQIELDKGKVLAGRKDVAALLDAVAKGAERGTDARPRPQENGGRTLVARVQRLMTTSVFHHLWFLWFLCWLVPGFAVCALVADRLNWRGAPGWLIASPVRFLWLIPLTMAPQWYMGRGPGSFGPDTSAGLLPMPHVLAYYAIFFGFGALYYDAEDDDGRVGRWWLALSLGLIVALPLGLAFSMAESGYLGKVVPAGAHRMISVAMQVVYAWAMTFGLMGMFRALFSRERAWVRYVSDSSYWLYITHLPLIIWAQMVVRDWPAPAIVKFCLVCGVVSGALLLSYHAFVRYTWLGTLLNGPRRRPGRPPDEAAA